jgi:UV radiation resistance-associated gene protein
VETFITVAVFLPSAPVENVSGPSPTSATVRSPTNPRSAIQTLSNSSSQKSVSKPNGPVKPSTPTTPNKRRFISTDPSAKSYALKSATPIKQDSRKLNGINQSHASSRKGKSMVNLALESEASPDIRPLPSPVYFSPIHRPSTNPLFPIDTRSNWPDTSGQNLKVEVWGKMPIQIERPPTRLDEVERQPEDRNFSWKLLDEWNVNLGRLARLPNDVQTIFSSCLLTDWSFS